MNHDVCRRLCEIVNAGLENHIVLALLAIRKSPGCSLTNFIDSAHQRAGLLFGLNEVGARDHAVAIDSQLHGSSTVGFVFAANGENTEWFPIHFFGFGLIDIRNVASEII